MGGAVSGEGEGSGPGRRPATERGRATKRALLEAGEKLFGRVGYHETSVADLTREADVGHGTFYLYFEGKRELFRDLIRHLSHELRSTIARAVEGIEDRFEVERVGFETFFRFALEHRDLYTVVHQAGAVDPDLSRWYYRRLGEGYTEGLAEAAREGQIRDLDPEAMAYCLAGMGHMMGMRWVLWEGEAPPEAWMEDFMELLRHGLEPSPGPEEGR